MSAPPSQTQPGDQLDLAVDVKDARAGDAVTFTVAAGAGADVVATLSGSVASGTAQARWTVDPGKRELPLAVDITASLRGRSIALGPTTILSRAQVSTLGWLDEKGRVLAVDEADGARVAAAGDTVILKFDVSDGKGGAVQEKLDFTFILEREGTPGKFAEVGRFSDSASGVMKFERKFITPNDSSVPGTFRIVLEARRSGETGAAPSLGRRISPPLKVIVASPLVTSFVGTDPDTGSDHPAEQVFLGPGKKARLFWDVLGAFQSVRLDPMKKDVTAVTSTAHEGAMAGAITVDPVQEPPDADGNYVLVAANQGLESPPRKVGVTAVVEFSLRLADGQTGKTLVDAKDKPVSEIGGLPEPLKDPAHRVQGVVTPFSRVVLSWKVLGAKDVKLRLKAENSAGDKLLVKDVTAEPSGSVELNDPSKGAVLDAELAVLEDKPQKPEVLARGLIHLKEGFADPELKKFVVLDGGKEVAPDPKTGVISVSSWDKLAFRWEVNQTAFKNRLEVNVKAAAGSFDQTLKAATDTKTLNADTPPTKGGPFDGEVTVDAKLLNSLNESQKGSRILKLKVGPGAPVKHKLSVRIRTSAGPLKGAKVTVTDKSGASKEQVTSDSGDLDFPDLQEGDVTVTARHDLFNDESRKLPLTSDDTVTLTLAQKSPAADVTLEAFVRFEAFDVVAKKFVAVDGVTAEVIDDGAIDTVLDTQTTGADGLAHFQVKAAKRPAGKAVDLKFNVKPAGKVIGGVTFPADWSTKGWRSPDGTQGMQNGFTASTLGSATAPVVFRVGVDFHLRIAYRFTPHGGGGTTTANAVKGVAVGMQRINAAGFVLNVGDFLTDEKGEVHGLTFLIGPGNDVRVDVENAKEAFASIENPDIHLPLTRFRPPNPGFWRSAAGDVDSPLLKDWHDTSIPTAPGTLQTFTGVGLRAGAMYIFKVLSEWSQFLTHVTDGLWKGIPDLKIFPHTLGGTSYSFPVGEVNFEPTDFFDRATIAHELSHQIMWQESDIGTGSIVGKVLTGHLHLHHTEDLLSTERTHPLIEGWAEFIEAIFKGSGYSVGTLRDDVSKAASIPIGPPPANRGEFCEGAFANGLFGVYLDFISGRQVRESADGNSFEPWMDDPGVRRSWKSAIWDPLQDLRSKSPPTTHDFLGKLKSMHPADWHRIAPKLHKFNMMMDPPTIASITPSSGPAGTAITIRGTEFEVGATVEFNGSPVAPSVVDTTTLTLSTPAGPKGAVNVTVKTSAGTSATAAFTNT